MADNTTDPIPPVPLPPVEPTPTVAKSAAPATKVTAADKAPAAPAAATPPPPPVQALPTSPYAPPAYAAPPAGPAQGLSIASMILGIGGLLFTLFGFGFLPALAAVITGHLAQKRQPYAKPFWLTGIITGYVGVGISLIIGIVLIAAIVIGIAGGAAYYGQ